MILYVLTILVSVGCCVSADEEPTVETPLGKVRGFTMTSRSGRKFLAFSGLPYAKPPLGELRFQSPEAVPPWEGIKDAKEKLPICIQYSDKIKNVIGVEDCLQLAVYTHSISRSAPVLFHIHGGAFKRGSGQYFQPDFLMDEDLVIVNINYRLGIYGFMTFETAEMPGNQGMKDQVMALRWVQQNIASFGGDPNLVTIIGESAGGASVYHHIVSPLSKGLFHRAVAESGTSYCIWGLFPPGIVRQRTERLMGLIGCPTDPGEAIPCAVKKDPREVVTKLSNFTEWQIDPLSNFGPVLEQGGDEAFLPGPTKAWNHNPVPLFMGVTSGEGLLRTMVMLYLKTDFKWLSEHFNDLAPQSLMYQYTSPNPDEVTKQLRKFYLPRKDITLEDDWVNLTTVYSDAWFLAPAVEGANKHTGPVYFYYFDYLPKIPTQPPEFNKYMIGAGHVLEARFIWNFSPPGMNFPMDAEDVKLSETLINAIAAFAKNGVPEIEGSDVIWEKWQPDSNQYVHIDRNGYHLEKGLAEERYNFWNTVGYRDNYDK